MQTTATNASAILRGEQRSARFKYRHCVARAAKEVGIPVTWIWFWLLAKRLKFFRFGFGRSGFGCKPCWNYFPTLLWDVNSGA